MSRPVLLSMLCAALLVHSAGLSACSRTASPPPASPQAGTEAAAQTGPAAQPVSQMKLYLLSAVSALSPHRPAEGRP